MRNAMKRIIITMFMVLVAFVLTDHAMDIKVNAAAVEEYIALNTEVTVTYGKYWFHVTEPGVLRIKPSTGESTYQYFDLILFDEITGNKYEVAYSDRDFYLDETFEFNIGSGLYYLYFQYNYDPYTIRVEFDPVTREGYEKEWNDSFDKAQEIKTNILYTAGTLSGREVFDYKIDYDYYKFTLDKQGSVNIYMKKANSQHEFKSVMELYREDKDGNVTLIDTTTLESRKSVSSGIRYRLNTGTYYLKYNPDSYAKWNYGYQFKVNYTPESPSEYETEDNNKLKNANLIDSNKNYTGNLHGNNDIDYYSLSIKKNSYVKLKFNQPRETKAKTYKIQLYQKSNDNLIYTITTNSNPVNKSDEILLKTGDYYIKVSSVYTTKWSEKVYNYSDYDISMIDYKLMAEATPVTLIEKIELSTTTKKLYTGETMKLKATISPSNADRKELLWFTSDSNIAEVDDDGNVIAISSGECYITANATDGSGITTEYHLVVYQNTNKKLQQIKTSVGTLSPVFSASRSNYILDIGRNTSVTITLAAENKYATIYIDDKKATKKTIKLSGNKKTIVRIAVVAENGDEKNYTITVKGK